MGRKTYICDECGEPFTYDLMVLRGQGQFCVACDRRYLDAWVEWHKKEREAEEQERVGS